RTVAACTNQKEVRHVDRQRRSLDRTDRAPTSLHGRKGPVPVNNTCKGVAPQMNANNSRSRLRRGVAAAVTGFLTVSGLVAAGVPATAHDGVDHAAEPGAEAALDWSNYEKTTLTKDVGEPLDMAVLPDGRVLHTARNGDLRLTDPGTGI